MGLMSYIFFQLHDIVLGVVGLTALSAAYTLIRLYLVHRKWWLLGIMAAVAIGSIGFAFTNAPTASLYINGQQVTGSSIVLDGGSVSVNPAPEPNGEYPKDTTVTLAASPSAGYDWQSWSGTQNDASNPTTVVVGKDDKASVAFEPRVSLIINNQLVIGSYLTFPDGSISVSPAPGADGKYSNGTVVTLTAAANSGYNWTAWTGTSSNASNPAAVTMSGSVKNVSAVFEPRFFLTIANQLVIGSTVSLPQGSISVSPAPGPDGEYAYGAQVVLTATTPSFGYDWTGWVGTGNDMVNPVSLTLTSNKYVSATFAQRFLLTVNGQQPSGATLGATGGSISLSPSPGADGLFPNASTVTLTAVAASGYRFDHWAGDVSGSSASISVNMTANKNVTAVFIQVFTLTINVNPSAGGSVTPVTGTYDAGLLSPSRLLPPAAIPLASGKATLPEPVLQ